MMNNEKEKDAIDTSKLDEILPKYDPLKLNSINLAQNYVSAFNTGMNIYQCVNQLQGYIEWVVKAVNDVVKSWNVQVGESIDQSKAIVRETTTEQFNTEWTNKQPELIEQVNTLTTNQFNIEKSVFNDELNTLDARMDTFTRLSEGSTTGDAELKDIRVGANGVTYNNAGDAVRGQYSQLKEDLSQKIRKPTTANNNKVPRAKNGDVEWVEVGQPTDTQTETAVTNWLNEHPEATTTVQDGALTELKFSDALKLKAIKDYVTPQMFGALGDGVTDDTKALQDCFKYAYDNKLSVFIPSGTYNHTGLTIQCADFGSADYVPMIYGNGRSNTKLNHIGVGVGVSLIPKNNNSYINGIIIRGLAFNGNENTTIGIELHEGTRIEIDNINITNASVAGIKQAQNFWVSSLTNIYIGDCATGIDITSNSATSIFYNLIYVDGSTVSAYHLTGIYSEIGILCADHCTGDNVYNFESFSGTINSIGCETCNVSTLFRFRNSTCSVNSVYAWMPFLDGTLKTPILCSESMITITALNISGTTGVTSEIPLAKMYYAYLTIDNLNNGYLFSKPIPTVEGNTSALTINGVKIRISSYRAYLGTDRCLPSDLLKSPFDKTKMGVAIYTSCTKNPSYLADGTDVRWNTPVRNGDWFIENDPAQYNVAGYVIMQDYTDEVGDAKRGCIPLLLSGSSANRPTTIPIGGMFFDTTLGKPIWYNGNSWVDAAGNPV